MIKDIRANRLKYLPPYLFAEIDRSKRRLLSQGRDLIDLSVGDPDLPPPAFLVSELKKALADPKMYHYPSYQGTAGFCRSISDWYRRHLKISISPENEIWSLIGSKEGLAHLVLALVNPGDIVLVPDPCFPMYRSSVRFAGGIIHSMPITQDNDYLPDLSLIKPSVARRTKLMLLNYPNNPTSAIATREFYQEAIRFAGKYGIIICQDAAYEDIYYGTRPISFLEVKGAKEVGVETRSFTKMLNIAGWRVGWLAGNERVVKATGQLKTNIDSGLFTAFQKACAVALQKGEPAIAKFRHIYQERRGVLVNGLQKLGWQVTIPQATFYLWVKIPSHKTSSIQFCKQLLEKCGIAVTPGVGFGVNGEGYIRLALTAPKQRLEQAITRLNKFSF
jgi:LL-diaminopimelate aminotransferase